MNARTLGTFLLLIACCLQQLPAQSNPSLTPQDEAALKHLVSTERVLAAKGSVDAQAWLGEAYYFGFGVPQDYAQAAAWSRKAAMQGDPGAQYMLGSLYLNGEGIPQDYSLAYFWLDLAAAQRSSLSFRTRDNAPQDAKEQIQQINSTVLSDLIDARDKAASHLTRTEVLRVQREAEQWLESHQHGSHAQ